MHDVLEAVLEPSKAVSDQYSGSVVTTKDGKARFGRATKVEHGGVPCQEVMPATADAVPEYVPVADIASIDPRARVVQAPPLPAGWSGKQHACWRLAHLARHPLLLFIDADVRLKPDALARTAAFLEASGADLVSGIPHQETVGFLEKLVIPLIHFILLGFLPMRRMRRSTSPRGACASMRSAPA